MAKEKERDKKAGKEQLLLEAARLGDLQQLELVLNQLQQLKSKKKTNPLASLRKSVGPNSIRDPVTGFTCLHHAALNGHSDCVRLILDYGTKLNALDYKGSSALHLAAWAGNLEVVKILVSRRQPASPSEANQQSPNSQLQQRVDLDLCNNDNQTPLSLAAQFGHHQVVAELLASGANLHLRNSRLESPLDLACLNGRLETVSLLLDSSAALVAELQRPRALLELPEPHNPRPVSVSGDLWSSPNGSANPQTGGHARRPSASGWSSFLRGRRDSTGGAAYPTAANQQSPLQRFAAGTLSVRQKSLASQQQGSDQQQVEQSADPRRRATLTVGASVNARELAKQMSLDAKKDQTGGSNSQTTEPAASEKLLDHSPLHYATRKGHVHVVKLLLYSYQANILQVTSLGSVLHEIAMNNGKHSEMIGLFFNYIAEQEQQQDCINTATSGNRLNSFLSLLNEKQRTVFEVLNEINNRSAQEIKRLIYEYSDQIQQSHLARPAATAGSKQSLNTQAAYDYSSQDQQQPPMRFSDIHHFNSFVTMKRVPKNQQLLKQLSLANQAAHLQPVNQMQLAATQTVDRRASARRREFQFDQAGAHFANSSSFQQQQVPFNQDSSRQLLAGDQQAISRSVSNLSRAPIQQYSEQSQRDTNLMWQQWLTRGPNQHLQQQQADSTSAGQARVQQQPENRKQRSKSRDLGSLLIEAHQLENQAKDHLYDNNAQVPRGPTLEGCEPHLVRSQTDCSHLMSRFFGSGPAQNGQQQQLAPQDDQQHPAAADRRMINRHYHVYDHQFYPPRLLGQREQKPALLRNEPAPLRASTRSTASSQSSNRYQHLLTSQQQQQQQVTDLSQQVLRNNSRLSLNMDSQVNGRLEQVVVNDSQQQQRAKNADRFLARHSRKSGQQEQQVVSAEQKRQALVELQRRLLAESLAATTATAGQISQLGGIQNSHSLESHLSEPHLFESTRRALMKDFDKMIGQELLNRDHRPIIEGGLQAAPPAQVAASMLTGVSLDMDRYGERLTVSGTRITMPAESGAQLRVVAKQRSGLAPRKSRGDAGDRLSSCSTLRSNSDEDSRRIASPGSNLSASSAPLTSNPREPPPKPPRPSLLNRPQQPGAIYDLPATAPTSTTDLKTGAAYEAGRPKQQVSSSQTLSSSQTKASGRVAHTDPPKVRPPPPPPCKALSSPLHIAPPSISSAEATGSSSSSSAGSADIGLLKMAGSPASQRRLPNHLALVLNASQMSGDPDSGVCTSNSPASLSHDSEGTAPTSESSSINSKRMRPAGDGSASANLSAAHLGGRSSSLSTPVPANVDQQLELSPARAPPSPKTAQLCIEEALLPLAMTNKTADQTTSPLNTASSSARDVVDRWLMTEQPRSRGEADYENCRSLQEQLQRASCKTVNQLLAGSSPMDSLERVDDDADYAGSSSENSALSSELSGGSYEPAPNETVGQVQQSEEVLLKVVIDKSEKAANGDEVFYINPIELKRLAAKQNPQLDSGSLTDEELCAAIDKNSGYIRFTLRKRRNGSDSSDQVNQNSQQAVESCNKTATVDSDQPVASCLKRTKLNLAQEPQQREPDEMVLKKEGSMGCDVDFIDSSSRDRQELNNGAIFKQIQKHGALRLSQWFSTNLTGLAEYQSVFLQNGLDNMQFLNHRKILNDQTLKLIGIHDESHRTLIVERVSKELPQANFDHILNSLSPEAGKVSLLKVLELLQLEHLGQEGGPLVDEQVRLESIGSIRAKSVNLPTGHRLRLSAALDFLEDRLLAEEAQKAAGKLAKQLSSESSEVEMEASQASATSSSSKESIRSIVLMKTEQSVGEQVVPVTGNGTRAMNNAEENKENESQSESKKISAKVVQQVAPVVAKTGRSSSLVSEAARKLEAAAAQRSTAKAPLKPVAAARKVNNKMDSSISRESSEKASTLPWSDQHAPVEKSADKLANGADGKEALNSPKRSAPKTNTAYVPVKSICWPPKSTQQEFPRQAQEPPTVNKLSSIKSTYHKLLEENGKSDCNHSEGQQQSQVAGKLRPKPAPPVKPAKLAANKFNVDFSHKS